MHRRQRESAEERKQRILSSHSFVEWWDARQHIHPMPSDPYRAYMIDIGLQAEIHTKLIWRGRTPRADYPTIDLPSGVPAPKRRLPSRKEERRFKHIPVSAMPYGEKTPFEKGLQRELDKMSESIHVASPRLVLERREGALRSAYWSGHFSGIAPYIKLGVKGGEKAQAQTLAVLGHEFGHHGHAKRGLSLGEQLSGGVTQEYAGAGRITKEREAWTIADPFMMKQRPVEKFVKKYALGTYLGTSHRTGLSVGVVRRKRKK